MSEAKITIKITNLDEFRSKLDQLEKLVEEIQNFKLKTEVTK